MKAQMMRICAWCEEVLGNKEGRAVITYGICPGCKEKVLENANREIECHGNSRTDQDDSNAQA